MVFVGLDEYGVGAGGEWVGVDEHSVGAGFVVGVIGESGDHLPAEVHYGDGNVIVVLRQCELKGGGLV